MRPKVYFPYYGQMLQLSNIAKLSGININTLTTRVYKYGMKAEQAATMPVKHQSQHRFVEVLSRTEGVTL